MSIIRKSRRLPLAASGIVAGVSFALAASPIVAAVAAATPLSGTVSYSMNAPYVDSVRGTAISVSVTGSAFREDDSVFFGVIAKPGAAPSQVKQMDPTDDVVAGYHASASVSYPAWKTIGTVNWRVWIDANDNSKFDAGEKTLESTSDTAFRFAGPPTSINLNSTPDIAASGTPGDESYTPAAIFVAEGTCRMFHATVRDENGLGVKGQQLVLSFQSGVPGSKPVACTADQLAGLSAGAATTQDSGNILSGVTNNDGEVDFAIQGVKGKARYRGTLSFDLKVASPKAVTASSVDVVTKTGFNKGVSTLVATDVDPTPYKKSKSSFTVTATSADGLPLQGVVLSAAAMPVDSVGDAETPGAATTITTLSATNAAGQTTYVIDTSKSSVQRIYVWADLGVKGLGSAEIRTVVDITVQPQAISRVNSEFTAAQDVIPTDKANNTFTLTLKDTLDTPVKDVDVTFEQVKGTTDDADVAITPLAATSDGFGQISVGVSRPASNKEDQYVCVRATITGSLTGDTFLGCFWIEFRRATTLDLVTPSRFTAVNGSITKIRAKLLDQFQAGFVGPVVFKSTDGRNKDISVTATSNAAGIAEVSWLDKAGTGAATDTISISHTRVGDKEVLSAAAVQFDYVTAEQAVANNIELTNLRSRTYLDYDAAAQPAVYVRGRLQNTAGNSLFGRDLTVTATGPVQLLAWNGSAWTPASKIDGISDGEEGGFDFFYRATGAATTATFTVSDGTASSSFTTTVVATGDGARSIAVSLNKASALSGDAIRTSIAVTDAFGNAVTPNGTLCAKVGGIGRFTTGRLREYVTYDDFDNGTAAIDVMTNGGETGSMSVSVRPCDSSDDHFWAPKDYPFGGAPAATASVATAATVAADGSLAALSSKLEGLLSGLSKSGSDSAKATLDAIAGLSKSGSDSAKATLDAIAGLLAAVNSGSDASAGKFADVLASLSGLSKSGSDSAKATLDAIAGLLAAVNSGSDASATKFADVMASLSGLSKSGSDSAKATLDAIAGLLAAVNSGNTATMSKLADVLKASSDSAAALSTKVDASTAKLDALAKTSADAAAVLKQTTDLLSQVNGQLVAVNTVLDAVNSATTKLSGLKSQMDKLVGSMKGKPTSLAAQIDQLRIIMAKKTAK